MRQQYRHHIETASQRRSHQGRPAILVSGVHIRALLEQLLHGLGAAFLSRRHQDGSTMTIRSVYIVTHRCSSYADSIVLFGSEQEISEPARRIRTWRLTRQRAYVRRNAPHATGRPDLPRVCVFLQSHASYSNHGVAMDRDVFSKELEGLRGCQFVYLHESRKIEDLVQSYLESPGLHSLDYNKRLLYHLLNSEYAPLQRVARTGLHPGGFWVRRFPRVGPWVVYALFIAIWAVSIWYVLSDRKSTRLN